MQNQELSTIFEFDGTYGGRASRDQIIRALREALAVMEITDAPDFFCPPFRIQARLDEAAE